MPNNSGVYVYVDTSTTPWKGVSWDDVRKVLGISATDEATLCTSKKINKWARYKPERRDGSMPMSYNNRVQNHFGLEVPYCTDWNANVMNAMVYDFVYHYEDVQHGWKDIWNYLQPRGTQHQGTDKEFYRLSDFSRIPTDITDPRNVSGITIYKGYDKNARLPFNVSLDESSSNFYLDTNIDEWVYEVNKAVSTKLVFTFYNSIGDELHLQDFVSIPENESNITDSTIAWRPIIQVFNNYKGAGEDEWYERHSAQYEIAGDPITSDPNTFWQVAIDLDNSNFSLNQYYHVCIGVGYCKKDPTAQDAWGSGSEVLFLPPYTTEQAENAKFPFYCIIKPVLHQARTLKVTGLQFHVNSPMPAWVVAPGANGYFTIHSLMEGSVVGLTMTITKLRSYPLVFVKGTATATSTTLKIKFRETITDSQEAREDFLVPSVGPNTSGSQTPWAEDIDGIPIPAAQNEQEEDEEHAVTLYATMDIRDIPVNGYGWYRLYGVQGEQGTDVYDLGYFNIHKVQYTR